MKKKCKSFEIKNIEEYASTNYIRHNDIIVYYANQSLDCNYFGLYFLRKAPQYSRLSNRFLNLSCYVMTGLFIGQLY